MCVLMQEEKKQQRSDTPAAKWVWIEYSVRVYVVFCIFALEMWPLYY